VKININKCIFIIMLTIFMPLAGPFFLEFALNSDSANVINAAYPPPAPTLSSPANNASVMGSTVNFQWNASEGATEYQLEVQKEDDTAFLLTDAIYSLTSYEATGFPSDGTGFKWRVRAGNGSSWSNWSAFSSFTNITDDDEGFPEPRYIYYQNASLELVRIDYLEIIDNLNDNDSRLRNAARSKLIDALDGFRDVFVEEADRFINYGEAVRDGKNYLQAYADPAYWTTAPVPIKELIINPVSGEAEETVIL
jgi:hypothetical protein